MFIIYYLLIFGMAAAERAIEDVDELIDSQKTSLVKRQCASTPPPEVGNVTCPSHKAKPQRHVVKDESMQGDVSRVSTPLDKMEVNHKRNVAASRTSRRIAVTRRGRRFVGARRCSRGSSTRTVVVRVPGTVTRGRRTALRNRRRVTKGNTRDVSGNVIRDVATYGENKWLSAARTAGKMFTAMFTRSTNATRYYRRMSPSIAGSRSSTRRLTSGRGTTGVGAARSARRDTKTNGRANILKYKPSPICLSGKQTIISSNRFDELSIAGESMDSFATHYHGNNSLILQGKTEQKICPWRKNEKLRMLVEGSQVWPEEHRDTKTGTAHSSEQLTAGKTVTGVSSANVALLA